MIVSDVIELIDFARYVKFVCEGVLLNTNEPWTELEFENETFYYLYHLTVVGPVHICTLIP